MQDILVINPNSSEAVTARIRDSIGGLSYLRETSIDCVCIDNAPPGIESQKDIDRVIPLLESKIRETDYRAYVLACFSDPGITQLRRISGKSIFGIGECAYLLAMSMSEQFGIIAILPASCERQHAYLQQLGFHGRLAATISLNLHVSELEVYEQTLDRILAVAEQLISCGAGALILGCAGMAQYRKELDRAFGIPVIDPATAGILLAANSIRNS